jgi:transcriptional regulator with XRE-family HTH domain
VQLPRTREWREAAGLTQRELSRDSGVGKGTIVRIENGESTTPRTAKKIADTLNIQVADLLRTPPIPLGEAPTSSPDETDEERRVDTGPSLYEFLEERCGHAHLALPKAEFVEMFDRLPEDVPERRQLALEVNVEYNVFCDFPKNVTPTERLSMRRMIRDAIPEVAVKHGIALMEGGLDREYQEEAARIFEVERATESATA